MAKKYLNKYGKILTFFYFKYILNIIFICFTLLDEKEEYVGNLDEELPKVTLFSTKLIEYFFDGRKAKFYIVQYKNASLDRDERCQIIEKMFSQTKAVPLKKKKKKVKTEPVEKVIDTIPNDTKQNSEDSRKHSTKIATKKSRQNDTKNKSTVTEGKTVVAPPEPEVVLEADKESSEEEVKLVDTIKPLKEELKTSWAEQSHTRDFPLRFLLLLPPQSS